MTYSGVRFGWGSRPVAMVAALSMLLVGGGPAAVAAPAGLGGQTSTAALTNLSHLNFLLDGVPLKPVAGHTTYQLDETPAAQAPWTYANKNANGSFTRVGGGTEDPVSGYWSRGAFNADDIARAAVVYLRAWQQTGDPASRDHGVQTLRALTYLQTVTGTDAGNVVRWQQADGTLTPSPTPVESPNPSDLAESYWLARTVWALGEGYAAFKTVDPAFASFLQDRLRLALGSLNRQSLARYGSFEVADGVKVPAWLISGRADASAEAVLGLSAYVRAAPADRVAVTALTRLSEGIAAMSAGSVDLWPFGAILPWNKSQTLWHAWGGLAPAAVATAAGVLARPDLLPAAVKDAAQFTPQLLAAGGPDNSWAPAPVRAQISSGADSRVQGLVATAKATNAPGLLELAAVAAGWFFGANPAGAPAYDPATGVAVDGIGTDGRVNPNSGAESTVHALLSMLTLDANPALKAKALGIDRTVSTSGLRVVEAESGAITGGTVVTPVSAWTGEADWSGGAYALLHAGGTVSIPVPASDEARNVYPIVNQAVAAAGNTVWAVGQNVLGSTPNGGAGAQGITDAQGLLFPFSLKRALPAGATVVVGMSSGTAALDALLVQPLVATLAVTGHGGDATLFVSAAKASTVRTVVVPPGFVLSQQAFDANGKSVATATLPARVTILPGGFTLAKLAKR